MGFVDGENFTIQGQKVLSDNKVSMNPKEQARYWKENIFLWVPGYTGTHLLLPGSSFGGIIASSGIRGYYYTTLQGADPDINKVEQQLWDLGFTPRVFKKPKNRSSKGVDISLAKDMLSHAFQDHYDVAVLVAGDGDYVPLVEELKHAGKRVALLFFSETAGLCPALRLAADEYHDITKLLVDRWT